MKHNFNLNQIILLCENGEVITDDGTKFQITEVKSEVTDTPPAKSLKYEDVIAKEKPEYWIMLDGVMRKDLFELGHSKSSVYTERDAKKLRATAQLLVVMHAANGGEWIPKEGEKSYVIYYSKVSSLCVSEREIVLYQIYFRTREDAEKALADNKQLFNEYFGIDE